MGRKLIGAAAAGGVAAAVVTVAVHGGPAGAAGGPAESTTAVSGYSVSRLPVLPGTVRGQATAVDPTGTRIAGDLDTADGRHHVVMWIGSRLEEVDFIEFTGATVASVDKFGFIVGNGIDPAVGRSRAYMISGGGFFPLPMPAGGVASRAVGGTPLGVAAGTVTDSAGHSRVVVWPGTVFGVRTLPLPAGYEGFAVGMAQDGTVVARATQGGITRSFSWDAADRRTELLPVTAGFQAYVRSVANGFAIGIEVNAAGAVHTVRWDLTTHRGQTVPGLGLVTSVNARGDYAGQSHANATLVRAGTVVTLPGLTGETVGQATGVTDNRVVVGFSRNAAGAVAAVVWTPVT